MKRTWKTLLVSFVIATVTPQFAVAAKVTPGTLCKKFGLQQTYEGKRYTCIKVKQKLLWNDGKIIECPSPKFEATYLGSFKYSNFIQVIQFEYKNIFPGRLRLGPIMTNYPENNYFETWPGLLFFFGEDKWEKRPITFQPYEKKVISWVLTPWEFDSLEKKGRGNPEIYEARTQLLDTKYGGGDYCTFIRTLPDK